MSKSIRIPALSGTLLLAGLLSGLLSGKAEARIAGYDGEVEICVAAVNDHVDLDDAERVRHVVNLLRRTGIGRVLTIETSVVTAERTRTYSAYCVAVSDAPPVKFRISETTT